MGSGQQALPGRAAWLLPCGSRGCQYLAVGTAAAEGWGLQAAVPRFPGGLPCSCRHTPLIIPSITFINTLHSAGFFHAS